MTATKRPLWESVFAANRMALRGFLRRRVTQSWEAQDIAQEVYLRMLRLDEQTAAAILNPRAYLFTVAANLVKERAMVQRRDAAEVSIEDVASTLAAPGGSAEDEAEREASRRRLARTLDRLPPRCKAVLLMQHRDGMSYREIAEKFGVSTHMVKKYVVRALLLCRRDMLGGRS